MPEITVKARVTADHKLAGDVPEDTPVGEVEATLRPLLTDEQRRQRKLELRALLLALKASGRRADPQAIDERIRELRDSWE